MSTNATPERNETRARGGKYLTFSLGNEEYGLEILKVREIFGYMDVTAVPHTPAHVLGVINLRGQVISVIDLRSRLGMPTVERTNRTCIIVVEIKVEGRPTNVGSGVDTSFISGMGKIGTQVKILLDIEMVLGSVAVN